MMKFFKCSHCGNIIAFVDNKGVPVKCCGEKMEEIVANTVDAAKEKHVPVIKVDGNLVTVTVGDVAHPMLAEHSILWVALETKQGAQRKELAVGSEPVVQFALVDGDEVKAAYAYCNLHGLWKAEA